MMAAETGFVINRIISRQLINQIDRLFTCLALLCCASERHLRWPEMKLNKSPLPDETRSTVGGKSRLAKLRRG
jgi:hypothetical protein